MKDYGNFSETGKIKRILLKHPRDAFRSQEKIKNEWKKLNYTAPPDFSKSIKEYEAFLSILKDHVESIDFLPLSDDTTLDSIYVRDTSLILEKGAIICNMGKSERKTETPKLKKYFINNGIPILGEIKEGCRVEGGDTIILDRNTLIVGHGYRTNQAGIDQLRNLTSKFITNFIVVSLPHWDGPDDVLHLMSFISPITEKLAAVYSRMMPVFFRNFLLERDIKLIEVPDDEFLLMGCNILSLGSGKCLMLSGNKKTRSLLEKEGIDVIEYNGKNISLKGSGGPTCLTRPIFREQV
jgi:arginine deiminase